jgi:cathepsin A (carboxypeptidase C)
MLSSAGAGPQFGGQVVNFEHGFAFVTVHGSGHMVPTFRPRAALQLIRHVVQNSSFAPPVPDLAAMAQADFDRFVDTWVADAKSAAFVHP